MLLAIDTSTESAGLALLKDGEVLAEATWHCGQSHSVELLPHLAQLMSEIKAEPKTVTCVLVARGPGSFNGLRVGLSTAKGLAFSLDIPIISVSSLSLEAYPYAETGLPVCPIFNAGRGEIATATFQQTGGKWLTLNEEHIDTVDKLCSTIKAKTVFCGAFVSAIQDELKKKLKELAVIPPHEERKASLMAELAKERIEAGDYDNLATLQPLYLRRPAITKAKHR